MWAIRQRRRGMDSLGLSAPAPAHAALSRAKEVSLRGVELVTAAFWQ